MQISPFKYEFNKQSDHSSNKMSQNNIYWLRKSHDVASQGMIKKLTLEIIAKYNRSTFLRIPNLLMCLKSEMALEAYICY